MGIKKMVAAKFDKMIRAALVRVRTHRLQAEEAHHQSRALFEREREQLSLSQPVEYPVMACPVFRENDLPVVLI